MRRRRSLWKSEQDAGFTLVELVVSLAILGIIIVIAGSLMIASANSYSRLSGRISLSQASKQAMEQFSESAIDSSVAVVGTITTDNEIDCTTTPLCLVEYNGKVDVNGNEKDAATLDSDAYKAANVAKKFDIKVYKLKDKTLYYGEINNTPLADALDTQVNEMSSDPENKMAVLCENVESIGFDSDTSKKDVKINAGTDSETSMEASFIDKIHISLSLKKRGRQFDSVNDCYFRSGTLFTDSFRTLGESPYKEEVNDR